MSAKTFTREKEVEVEVEIGLDEWTSPELIAELEEREPNIKIIDLEDGYEDWEQAAFDALQRGDKDTALELLRSHLCDVTGRILP